MHFNRIHTVVPSIGKQNRIIWTNTFFKYSYHLDTNSNNMKFYKEWISLPVLSIDLLVIISIVVSFVNCTDQSYYWIDSLY